MNILSHNAGTLSIIVNKERSLDPLWEYLSIAINKDAFLPLTLPFFKKVITSYKHQIGPGSIISCIGWLEEIIKMHTSSPVLFQSQITDNLTGIINYLAVNGRFSSGDGIDFLTFLNFITNERKAIKFCISDEFFMNESLDVSMVDQILLGVLSKSNNFGRNPITQFNSGLISFEALTKLVPSSILGEQAKKILTADKNFDGMPDISNILNPHTDIRLLCEYIKGCDDIELATNIVSIRNYYLKRPAMENLMYFQAYIDGVEDDGDFLSDLDSIVSKFLLSCASGTKSTQTSYDSMSLILSSVMNNQVASMDGLQRVGFYNSMMASHELPQKIIASMWQDVEQQLSVCIDSGTMPGLTVDDFRRLTIAEHKSYMEQNTPPTLLSEASIFLNLLTGQELTIEQGVNLARYKFTVPYEGNKLLVNKMKDFGFPEESPLPRIFGIESYTYPSIERHHMVHGPLSPGFIKYALSSKNMVAICAVQFLQVIPDILASDEVNKSAALDMESFLSSSQDNALRFIKYGVINSSAVLTDLLIDTILYIKKAGVRFDYMTGDFSGYLEFIQDMSPVDHEVCVSKILELESSRLSPALISRNKRYSI
ncbi:hypothetical protein ACK32R_03720 [Aeromonas dhakensis]|uniref:hypothetical protein n=1 Tax=Aeromonas dhakensis TaxID=196024 RepID=UPI0039870C22